MRYIIYCIIIIAVLLVPVQKIDIGDLEQIQALWLYTEGDQIAIETDTDDYGVGKTVDEAIVMLKNQSEGIVYLDTAQFLLVSENAVSQIEDLAPKLKGSVKICLWEGDHVPEAAKYMQSHHMGCKLKEWSMQTQLEKVPNIHKKEGTQQGK